MRRSITPAPVIPNDHLEHSRIQLEQNLRNSEAAIHLSSATESEPDSYESNDDLESLEYPRHNANNFNQNPSFYDHVTDEEGPGHGWSYRTGDDYEEGINPYGGGSLSTVAHHASAVTLGAGLRGRSARQDISLSGAEYDPDRSLNKIIAAVTSNISIFDGDSSFKRVTLESVRSDPLVVEDTAELDEILETGAQPPMRPRSVLRMASPVTSGPSSHSDSDAASTSLAGRPKLSDALRNVTLSPKRPRSPQVARSVSPPPKQRAASSLSRGVQQRPTMSHVATPRPPKRTNIDVVLQPPTPSQTSSKFTRMAHGLAKEIEYEKGQLKATTSTKRNKSRSKIQLPDVTGITNAIESPAKPTAEYYAYRVEGRIRETENRLFHTLNTVQKKLQQLEEENSISRRRVRELEMELEDCKREVARERTRIIEQEELLKRQQQAALRATKGKGRARDVNPNTSLLHERYKEVVEEKKALEALITSLRTHLARLTSELSAHRELLTELHILREADSATLRDKSSEITRLKNEVERLAGEVEVLRGVVEEGLRERRAAKEASSQFNSPKKSDPHHHEIEESVEDDEESEDEDDLQTETEDPGLSYASAGLRTRKADRTLRTDRATEGSSRVIDALDFDRISAEIDERRSDHSGPEDLSQFSQTRSPVQSPSPKSRRQKSMYATVAFDMSTMARRASSPDPLTDPEDAFDPENEAGPSIRPLPDHHEDRDPHRRHRTEDEAPFPKIRGKRLERLFFAAPEHDARTCSTCNRRRRESDEHPVSRAWRAQRTGRSRHGSDEDEGFAEGSERSEHPQNRARAGGRRRERSLQDIGEVRSVARQEGLPPQTIVARIIRELEDDFTHYKSIYIELADQYKEMDAASNVAQRNTLAKHLREVVDILEQKGDQIASLYDQLSFTGGTTSHRAGASSRANQTRTR